MIKPSAIQPTGSLSDYIVPSPQDVSSPFAFTRMESSSARSYDALMIVNVAISNATCWQSEQLFNFRTDPAIQWISSDCSRNRDTNSKLQTAPYNCKVRIATVDSTSIRVYIVDLGKWVDSGCPAGPASQLAGPDYRFDLSNIRSTIGPKRVQAVHFREPAPAAATRSADQAGGGLYRGRANRQQLRRAARQTPTAPNYAAP